MSQKNSAVLCLPFGLFGLLFDQLGFEILLIGLIWFYLFGGFGRLGSKNEDRGISN
ncbi:hypothetical protein D3C73_1305570 [compost metagenome]|jgi:hypothetical protein